MVEIKSVSQLVEEYKARHPDGHFFDTKTLKFFGERMSEMRLLKGIEDVTSAGGFKHRCYVISSVQRPGPPMRRRRVYHYFDVDTLNDVIV